MYYERLKKIREEKNLTLQEVSKLFGFEKDTYGKYERENAIIPLKHLINVCNYFDVSLDYIFSFNSNRNYPDYDKETNNIKVGERLKAFRKENGLTLKKLAKILHTTDGTLAGYESGRYLIATPFLYEICVKYKISADFLLGKIDQDFVKIMNYDIIDNILNVFENK